MEGTHHQPSAMHVLQVYRALVFADLHGSQTLDYYQWKELERQIELVRRRLLRGDVFTDTLWDDESPRLLALLDPVQRPLVQEFLEKLVKVEMENDEIE